MRLETLVGTLTLLDRKNWNPSWEVSGITSDSRRVKAGDLFVACPGPNTDGYLFLKEALQKGAKVIVAEKLPPVSLPPETIFLQVTDARKTLAHLLNQFYDTPSSRLRLVGITGTNGKTTIAYLLGELLSSKFPCGYIGTLGYQTPTGQGRLSNTTPGAEELFSLLARMANEGTQAVAVEVSSHALHQRRVCGLGFELGVFTQLSAEHLDYHGTLENYFQAKRLLFAKEPRPKKVLVNQDSSYGRRLVGENSGAKTFSIMEPADFWAREITTSFEGSEFIFESARGRQRFRTSLPMLFNVANVTCVLAALELLGFDPGDFGPLLESFPGVPGRLERMEGNGFSIFVDYAHTPDAFENVLSEARRLGPRRVLTLFGCGGDRDPYKRPEMTRIAYHYSDIVILTSDNPRTEDPAEILRQMRKGLPSTGPLPNALEILDRRVAIQEILTLAEPGDVVFILGKGHEDSQILGNRKIHFDDREVVREFLKKRRWGSPTGTLISPQTS